jgi:fermentation-respiration switch protein FrsA (DUF1100 family)
MAGGELRAVLLALCAAYAAQQGVLWAALRTLALTAALLLALLLLKQEEMLYIPQPDPGAPRGNASDPAQFAGMPFENCRVEVPGTGEALHCWLISQHGAGDPARNRAARATMVYFHGNAGNIGNRLPYYHDLWRHARVNILAVDYRGYGESEGRPSEQALQEDARAVLRFAQNHPCVDPDKLVVFGRSLGGAVGIDLLAGLRHGAPGVPRALIVENTFLSVADIALVLYPFLRLLRPLLKRPLLVSSWPSKERIGAVAVPILFVSGEKDELIPPAHMRELFRLCPRVKGTRFCSVPGGSHNDTPVHGGQPYYDAVRAFIDDSLASGSDDSGAAGAGADSHPLRARRDTGLEQAGLGDGKELVQAAAAAEEEEEEEEEEDHMFS